MSKSRIKDIAAVAWAVFWNALILIKAYQLEMLHIALIGYAIGIVICFLFWAWLTWA